MPGLFHPSGPQYDSLTRPPPGEYSGVRYSTITLWLFGIYFIGAHLRLSIYSGGSIIIPMYLMVFSGSALLIISARRLATTFGPLLLALGVFLLAQPPLSAFFGNREEISYTSSAQLLASIAIALVFIDSLSQVENWRVRRLLWFLWVSLVALILLESIGLKPIFDLIREAIYSEEDRGIYLSEHRDLELYGKIRATALASEPSFLADSLFSIALLLFFLDSGESMRSRWIRFAAMVVFSFLLSPSLKAPFYVAAAVMWTYWPERTINKFLTVLSIPVVALLLWLAFPYVADSIESWGIRHVETGSFYGRIQVGPEVAVAALMKSPAFGAGLGGADEVYGIVANMWWASGAFARFPWYEELGARDLMSNGFWWQWIFLGAAGGLIFVCLLILLLKQAGVTSPMRSLVCTWVIWYAGSAFVDPHSWYSLIVFSLGAVYRGHLRAQQANA